MSFVNQVVVITGASSGIGWSLAKELSRQGAKLGLIARRRENLERLAAEIVAANGTAAIAAADVADREQTVSAVRALAAQLGPIDVIVANAGVGAPTHLDPMNVPDVERMFEVNVFGMVYAFEAALPDMLARKKGHLVAVSSAAAHKGLPGESAYCASKAAMNVYAEGLRIQLRPCGVAVTTICPGFVTTPMTSANKFDMPWLMDADKAARLMAWAIARKKSKYTFPWQMRILMWASRFAPDWFIAKAMKRANENPPTYSAGAP